MTSQPQTIRTRRIVLTTVGSLGDLYPYVALALGLKARDHDAIIATSSCYRPMIESLGLGFHPIRPDSTFVTDVSVMRRMMHSRWGTVRVGREILGPAMRDTYQDVLAASAGADLLVSHPLTAYATRLVGEMTGVTWASTMITPLGFMSARDFPIVPVAPTVSRILRLIGPTLSAPLIHIGKRATRGLAAPWYQLRKEIGLPPAGDANPLLDSHSPRLVLALFSSLLAAPKPDWPPRTVMTGFPIFDRDGGAGMTPELRDFLDAGPPPVVFTLGCSAAVIGDDFFKTSIAAAERIGRRAVLIVGRGSENPSASVPNRLIVQNYVPFSELFPKAAAIVHAGGIGTTGLAMRSGRPSIVVPYAHDQPDNAARLERLGVARVIPRRRYAPARVASELQRLLSDSRLARRASEVEKQIRQEDGVRAACDALEELLN